MSDMSTMDEVPPTPPSPVSQLEFLIALLVPVIFATFFVTIRLYHNRFMGKGLAVDDCIYYGFRVAVDAPTDFETKFKAVGRLSASASFIGGYAAYFAKVPILLLYLRLFGGVYKWLRVTCYLLFILPAFALAGSASYCTAFCAPEKKTIDLVFMMNCMEALARICLFNGVFALVSDLIIFVLPLPPIANLTLPPKKKFGLFVVFMTGLLAITANAVAVYYRSIFLKIFEDGGGAEGSHVAEFLGPIIEASVALVVSTAPAISSFWRRQVVRSSIFSKVSSLFSSQSTKSQSTATSNKITQGSSGFSGSADPLNTDPYHVDPYSADMNGYHELDRRSKEADSDVDLPQKAHFHTTVQVHKS